MSHKKNKVPAVVIGFNGTALGIIRELGRKTVPVVAVDSSKSLGYFSRYCKSYILPDMEKKSEAFFESLIALSAGRRPVLFPSNDIGVQFMARYYRELEPYFRITFQKPELIERIVNKDEFYKLAKSSGILVPNTLYPKTMADLAEVSQKLRFPIILKPVVSTAFERATGAKLVKIGSPAELEKEFQLLYKKFSLMAQEIVTGADEAQVSCAVYMDRSHRPLAVFTARKVRSHPIEFGVGTLVESIPSDSFASIAINFLREIGYVGIAEVEFKKDSLSGKYWMIEINTRSWAQNILAERCGMPLSYLAYRDAIGESPELISHHRTGIKWISVERDIYAYLQYKEKGLLSTRQFMKSLIGKCVFSIFSFDDPMPFLYYFFFLRRIRLRTVLKKVIGRGHIFICH